MRVGYVRVSTAEQNPARQVELMKSLDVEKVFLDKISGKNTDRPQFNEMLSFLRDGDTLYVESFSRLSRSTKDLLNTVGVLSARGVQLVSDKEKVDTNTPQGRFMLTVFAALSELERENILERQREGIEIAKAEGKYKGAQTDCRDGQVSRRGAELAGGFSPTERRYRAVGAVGVHILS